MLISGSSDFQQTKPFNVATTGMFFTLLVVVLLISLSGCRSTPKNDTSVIIDNSLLVETVPDELVAPTYSYLDGSNTVNNSRNKQNDSQTDVEPNSDYWMTLAKSNFKQKKYARALRAAQEALALDANLTEANKIAMLSSVYITQANIDVYHDESTVNEDDKIYFKNVLNTVTTLVNSPENQLDNQVSDNELSE